MWTKKGVVFVGGGIILLFTSLIFKNYQFALMGTSLLSYVFMSSILRNFLQVAPIGKLPVETPEKVWSDVEITRELSTDYTFEDGELVVRLTIKNRRVGRTALFEIFDTLPNEVKLKRGSNYIIASVPAGQQVTYEYALECPLMGPYTIGPIMLRTGDVSNMFFKEEKLSITTNFLVLPRIDDLGHLKVMARVPKLFSGAMSFKQPGEGSDFYSLREYVPGDPFKKINWKAYSKTGVLMVNEYEWEAIHDVTIILDAREVSGIGYANKNALLYGARAAASICSYFMSQRNSVGLVIYSDRVFRITPHTGEQHMLKMLSALAGARPEGNMPLRAVADVMLPHLTSRSPVILISNMEDDDSFLDGISYICAMGFNLTVLSIPTTEIEYEAEKVSKAEHSTYRLERSVLNTTIASYGARIIDWDLEVPLSALTLEV